MKIKFSQELLTILGYARDEAMRTGCYGIGADHIVLGCTHYPFLQPVIERLAGPGVTVVNPAPAVARQAQRLLNKKVEPSQRKGSTEFCSSSEDLSVLLRLSEIR